VAVRVLLREPVQRRRPRERRGEVGLQRLRQHDLLQVAAADPVDRGLDAPAPRLAARRPASRRDPGSRRAVDRRREPRKPVALGGQSSLDRVRVGVVADRVHREPRAVVRERDLHARKDEPRLRERPPRVAVAPSVVEGEPAEQARAGGLGPGVDVAGVEQIVGAGPDPAN